MNDNPLAQNKYYWFYLIGFFLILILPLLTVPPWFVPPSWGSSLFFRIILSILIFFFLYQLFQSNSGAVSSIWKTVADRKNKVFWPFWLLIAFWLLNFLATIFSPEPHFSFWGSPHRSGGFLNFSFYIIFAVLALIVFRAKDWKKVWFFAFIVGISVCGIAFIQKFQMFKGIFIPSDWQPYSTLGGPSFLAFYLLLLSFLPLSFGLSLKNKPSTIFQGNSWYRKSLQKMVLGKKSIFYFFCSGLFIFTIFMASGRAALLGLAVGFLFFLFFYPSKSHTKKLVLLKILTLVIFVGGIAGMYWLNSQPQILESLKKNKILAPNIERIWQVEDGFSFRKLIVDNPRFSAWIVSWEAIKERPILGYGPENFSIGFDKHYNPALPGIENEESWWDRAHNFIFDISVTAGIPALIIFLSFFAALFWQLERLKKQPQPTEINPNQNPIVAHAIQATFISYFVANLFSFDIFATYLILFLIIGYSLFLIHGNNISIQKENERQMFSLGKGFVLTILFLIMIWFIWSANLKIFKINKELSLADYYSTKRRCQEAFDKMEEILPTESIIDCYVRLRYVNILGSCVRGRTPEEMAAISQKAIELLKEAVELRPYYTRSWFLLGGYTTTLIKNSPNLSPEQVDSLKEEVYQYFKRAHELRPKSQMVYKELIKAEIAQGNDQKAKEDCQKCLGIKSDYPDCWWLLGLTNIYLGEEQQAKENIEKAMSLGFALNSETKLLQLVEAYAAVSNYQELIKVYKQLLMYNNLPQYHASLATVYKEVGDYENARKEALIVMELAPEVKAEVEEFLNSLPAY